MTVQYSANRTFATKISDSSSSNTKDDAPRSGDATATDPKDQTTAFWMKPDYYLGSLEQGLNNTRQTYEHSLWPQELVQQLRAMHQLLTVAVDTGNEADLPEEQRPEMRRRKDDAQALARSAEELASEIVRWDTWPRTIWRWTGGRIAWGVTLILNGVLALFLN